MSGWNARWALQQQRELLRDLNADIVFLQEVRGQYGRHLPLSSLGQHDFLAENHWPHRIYGRNASHASGHHGNAILSKFPVERWENVDISASVLEQRGLLHGEIHITGWRQPLHCICVHLGLFSRWRREQLMQLNHRIHRMVPHDAPLIIAGDFNDWGHKARHTLMQQQHLHEVFELAQGKPARSFPAFMPLLRLDRIYTRGFTVTHRLVHSGARFAHYSDHAALSATLVPT